MKALQPSGCGGTWVMRRWSWLVTVVAALALTVGPMPVGRAEPACVDVQEARTGALRWVAHQVVFSASTAIATRTLDLEPQGGGCAVVQVRCEALAADGSSLRVEVYFGGASYVANYRGLLTLDDGPATCASVRQFEGTNGAVRVLFEG